MTTMIEILHTYGWNVFYYGREWANRDLTRIVGEHSSLFHHIVESVDDNGFFVGTDGKRLGKPIRCYVGTDPCELPDEAYDALPEPYKADSCVVYWEHNGQWFAEPDEDQKPILGDWMAMYDPYHREWVNVKAANL